MSEIGPVSRSKVSNSPSLHGPTVTGIDLHSSGAGSKTHLFSFLFLLALSYLTLDFVSYNNVVIVVYALFVVGIVLAIVNLRWGFYYLLVVSMLSDDTPRLLELAESKNFASVHFTTLGGFTLMFLWTAFMMCALLLSVLGQKKRSGNQWGKIDRAMLFIIAIYGVSAVIGIPNLLEYPRQYLSDLGYIVNTAVYYAIVRVYVYKPEDLRRIVFLVTTGYGIKSMVGVVYFILGVGTSAGYTYRVIFESGRALLVLVFFLCFSLFLYGKRELSRGHYFFLMLASLAIVFNIITFASTLNMIFLTLGLILLFFFTGRQKGIRLKAWLLGPVLVISAILITSQLRPRALEYTWWKIQSQQYWSPYGAEMTDVSTRLIELVNIVHKLTDEGSFLWGTGLGGWYTDAYLGLPVAVRGSTELGRLDKGFQPHAGLMIILLKFGFGGFVLYYLLLWRVFRRGAHLFWKIKDRYWKAVALGILVSLPVYLENWTSKINVFFGIVIAILACIDMMMRSEKDRPNDVV